MRCGLPDATPAGAWGISRRMAHRNADQVRPMGGCSLPRHTAWSMIPPGGMGRGQDKQNPRERYSTSRGCIVRHVLATGMPPVQGDIPSRTGHVKRFFIHAVFSPDSAQFIVQLEYHTDKNVPTEDNYVESLNNMPVLTDFRTPINCATEIVQPMES